MPAAIIGSMCTAWQAAAATALSNLVPAAKSTYTSFLLFLPEKTSCHVRHCQPVGFCSIRQTAASYCLYLKARSVLLVASRNLCMHLSYLNARHMCIHGAMAFIIKNHKSHASSQGASDTFMKESGIIVQSTQPDRLELVSRNFRGAFHTLFASTAHLTDFLSCCLLDAINARRMPSLRSGGKASQYSGPEAVVHPGYSHAARKHKAAHCRKILPAGHLRLGPHRRWQHVKDDHYHLHQ